MQVGAKPGMASAVQGMAVLLRTLVVGIFALCGVHEAHGQSGVLQREVDLLRARSVEFEREQSAYRVAIAANTQSATERADYAEFVAGLRRIFLEQCEVVRGIGGDVAIEDFPCVRIVPTAAEKPIATVAAVLTEDEKRAAVRAKLNALEDAIDEDLLKRQQEIRQASAQPVGAAASGGSASGGNGGVSGQKGAASDSSDSASSGSKATQSGIQSGANAASSGRGGENANRTQANAEAAGTNAGIGGALPPAPPSASGQHEKVSATDGGVGDDIVARQLREAAEKESDPTLKEKLWAEYRKYREAKK